MLVKKNISVKGHRAVRTGIIHVIEQVIRANPISFSFLPSSSTSSQSTLHVIWMQPVNIKMIIDKD